MVSYSLMVNDSVNLPITSHLSLITYHFSLFTSHFSLFPLPSSLFTIPLINSFYFSTVAQRNGAISSLFQRLPGSFHLLNDAQCALWP